MSEIFPQEATAKNKTWEISIKHGEEYLENPFDTKEKPEGKNKIHENPPLFAEKA